MTEIKPAQADAFLKKPPETYTILLVHGPDRGLVAERAKLLAQASGVDLADDFGVVRLTGSDIQADPARLADEAGTMGLFGGKRLIWVRQAGNERGLVAAVKALLEAEMQDTLILLEAGDLKKGTGLRGLIEKSGRGAALACYPDEGRSLIRLIEEAVGEHGLEIEPDAKQMLASMLGGDRLASRSELNKLALYALGKRKITSTDVLAVTGDAAALSADDAVDAVLTGDRGALDLALRRLRASKAALFPVLQGLGRQLDALDQMRARIEADNLSVNAAMSAHGRHIHFRRKPAMEKALALWSLAEIDRGRQRLQTLVLKSRKTPALTESIVQMGLLGLTLTKSRKNAAR